MGIFTILSQILYLKRLALSTFTEKGPSFSTQDSRLGPVIEKAKKNFLPCIIQDQLVMTSVVNHVQPPLTPYRMRRTTLITLPRLPLILRAYQ